MPSLGLEEESLRKSEVLLSLSLNYTMQFSCRLFSKSHLHQNKHSRFLLFSIQVSIQDFIFGQNSAIPTVETL